MTQLLVSGIKRNVSVDLTLQQVVISASVAAVLIIQINGQIHAIHRLSVALLDNAVR